jgi:hypothetical protein
MVKGNQMNIDFQKIFAPVHVRALRKERGEDDGDQRLTVADRVRDDDIDNLADQIVDEDDNDDDEQATKLNRHHIDQLADLVAESTNGRWDRARALRWMMRNRTGAAMVQRLHSSVGKALSKRKAKQMKNWSDVVSIAKGIAKDGRTSISEAELTRVITAYAKHVNPDLTPAAAFAKVFTANDATGLAFRKAVQVAKGLAIILPVVSTDDDVDDPGNALDALQALAAEQARRTGQPVDKCFAKVYRDNPRLAQAERRQARARLG